MASQLEVGNDVSLPRVAICFSGSAPVLEAVTMTKLFEALGPVDVFASVASNADKRVVMNVLAPKRCEVREEMRDGDKMTALGERADVVVTKDTDGVRREAEAKGKQAWINGIIFWSINHAHELVVEEEKARGRNYDFILRVRYDLLFLENTVSTVQRLLTELDGAEPTVVVPKICNYGGVNDQFAVGNRQGMEVYAEVWKNYHGVATAAVEDARQNALFAKMLENLQTEKVLEYTLQEKNVELRREEQLLARILRPDGALLEVRP